MSPDICLLITLLQNVGCGELALVRVALKTSWTGDEYYMEPENKAKIFEKLPAHVRSIGPIVAIEDIFEVEING